MRAIIAAHGWSVFRIALFPLLAAAIAWRLPVAFSRFWAEEGATYFSRAWHLPAGEALLALHSGYLNIVANAATVLARHSVPLETAPQVTAAVALAIQLLPAVLLATASEPWLRRAAPLLAAVALTALPGRGGEVWLNSINSHFHLMACTGFILALAPRGGATGALRLSVLLLAALSGPGNAFLWPFFLLRAWHERTAARWAQLAALSLGIAVQAALILTSPMEERTFGTPVGILLSFVGLQHVLLPVLGGPLTWAVAVELYQAHEAGRSPLWPMLLPVPFLAGLGWAAWRADASVRWMFVAGLWLAIASYASALALPAPNSFLLGLGCRYSLAPTLLFTVCVVGLAATADGARLRQAATGLVWWMLAVGTLGFHDTPGFTAGPDWRQEVASWRADPAHVLQIWPPGWTMRLEPPK